MCIICGWEAAGLMVAGIPWYMKWWKKLWLMVAEFKQHRAVVKSNRILDNLAGWNGPEPQYPCDDLSCPSCYRKPDIEDYHPFVKGETK